MTRSFTKQELRVYVKAQAKEIENYRWIESEKLGYDIGKERAQEEWIDRFAESFRKYWEKDHPIVFLICIRKDEEELSEEINSCLQCPYCRYVLDGHEYSGKFLIEDKPSWCR